MHMDTDGKQNILGMGLMNFLKDHNIKFNPRPFSNLTPAISTSQIVNVKSDSFVDFHMEIAAKVDALIAENEKESEPEFREVPLFEDYEQTVLNPLKQDLMQRYSLWLQ